MAFKHCTMKTNPQREPTHIHTGCFYQKADPVFFIPFAIDCGLQINSPPATSTFSVGEGLRKILAKDTPCKAFHSTLKKNRNLAQVVYGSLCPVYFCSSLISTDFHLHFFHVECLLVHSRSHLLAGHGPDPDPEAAPSGSGPEAKKDGCKTRHDLFDRSSFGSL